MADSGSGRLAVDLSFSDAGAIPGGVRESVGQSSGLADFGNGRATVEAKGFASSRAATGAKRVAIMARDDRVVALIQRRIDPAHPARKAGLPTVRERARLELRIAKLKALGDQFDHVCLSPFVAGGAATESIGRVGEVCVATEV